MRKRERERGELMTLIVAAAFVSISTATSKKGQSSVKLRWEALLPPCLVRFHQLPYLRTFRCSLYALRHSSTRGTGTERERESSEREKGENRKRRVVWSRFRYSFFFSSHPLDLVAFHYSL